MVNSKIQAVIQTLLYFDMFDYPLTREEIEKFLSSKLSSTELDESLKSKKIYKQGDYFVVAGRENIVTTRLERERISNAKLHKAKRAILPLRFIPTILFIGVSGSLAMKNGKKEDDIDLFIITKPQTLWLSRLLVNSLMLLRGNLRRFRGQHTQDTICTNMWIDTDHFHFSNERQNIYTAHEIVQLLPIINKDNIYEQFLWSNEWVRKFFPRFQIEEKKIKLSYRNSVFLRYLESFAEKFQLFYMQKHRTTEIVTKGFVAFHPNDYTNPVLQKWKEQQKKWHIK